ncbi:hypothetical protein AXG94_17625 [Pseudomonas corrugata]|nr:hypothetical protein AXG94_17625 [Pseudomonas corrugata]
MNVGASLLAKAECQAALIDCAGLIASRLAPTLDLWCLMYLGSMKIPCGSEPAREGGVSGDVDVGCADLIASEPAPTMEV